MNTTNGLYTKRGKKDLTTRPDSRSPRTRPGGLRPPMRDIHHRLIPLQMLTLLLLTLRVLHGLRKPLRRDLRNPLSLLLHWQRHRRAAADSAVPADSSSAAEIPAKPPVSVRTVRRMGVGGTAATRPRLGGQPTCFARAFWGATRRWARVVCQCARCTVSGGHVCRRG